jgi:hypothetical protein
VIASSLANDSPVAKQFKSSATNVSDGRKNGREFAEFGRPPRLEYFREIGPAAVAKKQL